MQMHKLMIAVLAAASLLSACSDATKDKRKETRPKKSLAKRWTRRTKPQVQPWIVPKNPSMEPQPASPMQPPRLLKAKKAQMRRQKTNNLSPCAKSPQLRAFFLRDCPRVNIGNP